MTPLSYQDAYNLAVKHGFAPGNEAATATAILMQESQGRADAFNPKDPHGGSVGVMQINGANAGLIGGADWRTVGQDPDASMAAAHALYARRGNFTDWGGYNDGGYKKYLNQAMETANATHPGTTITSTGVIDPTAQHGGPGAAPGTPGSTQNPPIPADATVVAANQPPQNIGDWIKKGLTRPADTTDKDGNPVKGKSPLEKLASNFEKPAGQQAPAAPETPQFAPVQDPMAQLAGPAAQLYSTIQATAAKPLSWSSRPYGWDAGQQMGTTLNTAGY
jgi:hypothetical protein